MIFSMTSTGFLKYIVTSLFLVSVLFVWSTSAQVPDGFLVEVSQNPMDVDEKVDLIVTAVRADWSTENQYSWSILMFFDSNDQVYDDSIFTVPANSIYTFIPEDLWRKVFSKALSVSRAGTYNFVVSDLTSASIEGSKTLIVGWDPTDSEDLQSILVISPASWDTISSSIINILWKTDAARAPLQVYINWKLLDQEWETLSNWEFNVFLSDATINSGQNTMQIRITNFDGVVIWKSPEIPFIYNPPASDWLFKWLTISPWTTIKAGEKITFLVQTDASVNSAQIKVWDVVRPLTKDTPTTFSNDVILDTPWTFPVDVTLILSDGERKLYEDQSVLIVKDQVKVEQVKLIRDAVNDWTIQVSWQIVWWTANNFIIQYGTQRDLLSLRQDTQETSYLFQWLTWDTYFFQITPVDEAWAAIWQASDIVSISSQLLTSAWTSSTCSVQWLSVSTARIWDSYYLVWPNIQWATNYIVYRSEFDTNSISNMQKIWETTDTKFAYPFDPYATEDQYAHYAVQAICSDWQTLQLGWTKKVQVGPATDLFFLFLITLLGYMLYVLYGHSKLDN